jgi:uncharacterized protein involved in response to NO
MDMDITLIVSQLVSLIGVGALGAAIVNVLKAVGVVKDGQAGVWQTGLQVLALAGLFYLNVFRPDEVAALLPQLDAFAAGLAQTLTMLAGLFVQIGGAQWAHGVLKRLGLPLLSKSFSTLIQYP